MSRKCGNPSRTFTNLTAFIYLLKRYIYGRINSLDGNILDIVKRNPLFLHEIEWKNNGFFFTTPNTYVGCAL